MIATQFTWRLRARNCMRTFGLISLAVSLSCCALDQDRTIKELNAELETKRAVLSEKVEANSYYATPDTGFELEASKAPLMDVMTYVSDMSPGKRLIQVRSLARGGKLAEVWTKCWPFDSRVGAYATLWQHDSLWAAFYLDNMSPSWKSGRGPEFELRLTTAIGGAIMVGGIEFCIGSTHVAPFVAVVVFPPLPYNKGRVVLTPVHEGIKYELMVDHRPFGNIFTYIGQYFFKIPFHLDKKLTDGILRNIVGKEGEIQVARRDGEKRKYSLDFEFDAACFLEDGLNVSGPIVITWIDPPIITENGNQQASGSVRIGAPAARLAKCP